MAKKDFFLSEIRYDIISDDWVIIAKGRSKRPFLKEEEKEDISPSECPFCQIETQLPPLLVFSQGKEIKEKKYPLNKDWSLLVIPNKFPALIPGYKMKRKKEGKYFLKISGLGYCELVITRDHKKHFPDFELKEIKEIFDAYQKRFLFLKKKKFVKNISIFHNHGKRAGATQPHCHSQIITTPLLENDLKKALLKAKNFWSEKKKCIYCEIQNWEMKEKKRIIYENEDFISL
ncbi:MAG: galactose-1-phosphate uridylyltransferase, partial [Minisyncoccales bacterium]